MSTMKSVVTGGPNEVRLVDVERPVPGPADVLLRVRAGGICGTDLGYVMNGGSPIGPGGQTVSIRLGHEPAGEVIEIGSEVSGFSVGDRVVVNPMDSRAAGLMGNGSPHGGLSEYLLIDNAVRGQSIAPIPESLPFDVAALNEPMAVARHCVNRSHAGPGHQVVVFGAGPIGFGATIWLKLRGVESVVVVDVIPERLEKALAVGADAVIDSRTEDVGDRLTRIHGVAANALGAPRPGTDIYIDAAGVSVVPDTVLKIAKWNARLVMVAVQRKPAALDLSAMLRSELTIVASMGYPTEIFEVTPQLAQHWTTFEQLISHRIPFTRAQEAFTLALTPGASEKVVITFD